MRVRTMWWIGGGLVAAWLAYKWWQSNPSSPGYNAEALREASTTPSPFANT